MTTSEGEPVGADRARKGDPPLPLRGPVDGAIAKRLFIAPVTVRNHIQNILHKLDVHTKLAAVVFAYQHDLI